MICGSVMRRYHVTTSVVRAFSTSRPFRVLGLQQIAIGGLSKPALSNFWGDIMGVNKIGSYVSEKENVDEDILSLGALGENSPFSVELDLMQPLDPNKAPKVHIPALNHIGLWIDDLQSAHDYLTSKGVRFTPGGIRKGAAGHDVCFIHPKGNDAFPIGSEGVLVELVQAPENVIAAYTKH